MIQLAQKFKDQPDLFIASIDAICTFNWATYSFKYVWCQAYYSSEYLQYDLQYAQTLQTLQTLQAG